MNDCPNAEIRDRLPDLLHERLDASTRAAVLAHVDACVDCRAELELLRGVHGLLLRATPRVDVNYVVEALPKPAPARVMPIGRRRHVWSDWRIAAAATLIIAGGSSVALLRRDQGVVPQAPQVAAPSEIARPSVGNPTPAAAATVEAPKPAAAASPIRETVAASEDQPANTDLGSGARLGDLNEQQLRALLNDIDHLQAVPVTEPEPVSIRVTSRSSGEAGI
jgi:hypothetical protein